MINSRPFSLSSLRPLFLCLLTAMLALSHIPKATAEQIKFCGTHWPPFAYVQDGKIVSGISYELYQEASKRLKWSVVMDAIPWPRCVKWVEKGVYSAGMDSVPREGTIHGQNPAAFFPLGIFVRQNFPQERFSWDLMKGKLVGMVNGYVYTEKIRAYKGWEIVRTKDEKQMVEMLSVNRFDFVLLDIFSGPILSKNLNTSIKQLTPLVDNTPLYPLFNSELKTQMLQFDNMLGELIKEGVADEIFRKHIPYGYSSLKELPTDLFIHGANGNE